MTKIGEAVKSNWLLSSVILLLLIAVTILSLLNRNQGRGLQEGRLLIKAGDTTLAILTVSDIQKLPSVEKKMVINSTKGMTKHEFTGASLLSVLNSVDPGLVTKYTKVITRGIDNYTSGVRMSEVLEPDNVYLVYADYGQPLKPKTSKDGTMQIIVYRDEFGQRFTNYVVSLELQ